MDGVSLFHSVLVFSNVAILVPLVPGGPIENRDFAHLGGVVYWAFNAFLISLGIFSCIATYAALIGSSWRAVGGLIVGAGFAVVYLLDLGKVFPTSPTPMGKALMTMEVVGTAIATYTVIVSLAVLST